MKLNDIVDLDTYPINQPGNQKYKDIINYNKKLLDNNGCCVLKNFIKEESINRMKQEAERKLNKVYWTKDKHNPYFIKDDETLPKDHPKRIFTVRESGYINSDDLEQNSDLNHLHDSDEMLKFVSDCLGVYPLYSGHYFPWHFDGNEFTLSILVQKSEKGGIFEYSPDLRSKDNENFENVTKVLRGDRGAVKSLDLKPGDLQIFKGRFSMHRVTKIEGKSSRYIALPCYVKDPYRVNKPEHSIQVYGKAMPIHYKRNNIEADGLTD